MPPRAHVVRAGTRRGEEPLGVSGGLTPRHAPFPRAGGLLRGFGAMVQRVVLTVFDPRSHLALRRPITLQLSRDHPPWSVPAPLAQLPKALLGSCFVPPTLHADVEEMAVVIHRTPPVMACTAAAAPDLLQNPRGAWLRTAALELMSRRLPTLPAALVDGFIRDDHPAQAQQLFDVARAQTEAAVQPARMPDHLRWTSVIVVGRG